jgi:probable rRNA maturation factor
MHAKRHTGSPKARSDSLRISIRAHCGAAHAPFLRRQIKIAHGILGPPLTELSLALVGDRMMSELHRRFMSIDGPTDVLTFPLEVDSKGKTIGGEVVICVPEARRCAKRHGIPLPHELLLYAVHGVLHLAGYDDRTALDFKTMHRIEDDLLSRMGIGPVFQPPRRSTALAPRVRRTARPR